jgi:exodeoxyribonuclease V beta subunit
MQGFLTGFIDLICQYRGKFYVMDYKTNFLEDYQQDSLLAGMRDHNYGLQYWIYSLVLHQYLQKRLPDYRYQDHFGGVRYLFVRGMQPEQPGSGVYACLPDLKTLDILTAFFKA